MIPARAWSSSTTSFTTPLCTLIFTHNFLGIGV